MRTGILKVQELSKVTFFSHVLRSVIMLEFRGERPGGATIMGLSSDSQTLTLADTFRHTCPDPELQEIMLAVGGAHK